MASLSSAGSVTSSNSLGNTSLRGFGGMVSGIQRDEIIEAMTLHTTNKIANQKAEITKLQWKQEAYRGLSDKILDLTDNYNSYSSPKALLDPMTFARNMITVKGQESSTNLVSATGASSLAANVSLAAVTQMATSTVRQSGTFGGSLAMSFGANGLDEVWKSSRLEGTELVFGTPSYNDNGDFTKVTTDATFKFASTYEKDGKTYTIDYTTDDYGKLADQLNEALAAQDLSVETGSGTEDLADLIEFKYNNSTGKIEIAEKAGKSLGNTVMHANSTALSALGYVKGSGGSAADYDEKGLSLNDFNANVTVKFEDAAINRPTALSSMTGQKLTFNVDGSEKEIELITKEEADQLKTLPKDEQLTKMAENLQKRLNQAFGTGAVTVTADSDGLKFETASTTSSVSVDRKSVV